VRWVRKLGLVLDGVEVLRLEFCGMLSDLVEDRLSTVDQLEGAEAGEAGKATY